MPWAKVTGIMQKANYGWSLVTIRKEIPHKRDKTEGNQMRKKSPSTMAHPLGGGRGIRGRGYVRIGKNMIFIIVLLFGNNLQYEFNIWLQGVVIRTAPPTLSHTHTHTHARAWSGLWDNFVVGFVTGILGHSLAKFSLPGASF